MVASFPYRIIHLFNHWSFNGFGPKVSVSLSKPIFGLCPKCPIWKAKHLIHVPYSCRLTASWMLMRCILSEDNQVRAQTATLNERIMTRQRRAPTEGVIYADTRCLTQWTRTKGVLMICNYSFIIAWKRMELLESCSILTCQMSFCFSII